MEEKKKDEKCKKGVRWEKDRKEGRKEGRKEERKEGRKEEKKKGKLCEKT